MLNYSYHIFWILETEIKPINRIGYTLIKIAWVDVNLLNEIVLQKEEFE